MLKKIRNFIKFLKNGKVIAYPTESVFSLGCDPDNIKAILSLITIKKRSMKKGFILISSRYEFLKPYIDENKITEDQKKTILFSAPYSITWVVPVKKGTTKLLTGKFKSIAIRITEFKVIKELCELYKKPLITTSANISGFPPCKTRIDLINQFKNNIPILDGTLGTNINPTKIIDISNGYIYR
ncbi:hypothetical protein AOQ88_01540 [Candidatus Riesia sp. GBBU]|nr:hypothetical protein AOQ88_01540 [Candidatus Riesia sp. GBBU]